MGRYVPNVRIYESIILQFIYNMVDYDKDKFIYLLNWIAGFFQNPGGRSNKALVFVGKDGWKTDFLFNNIIEPIFKEYYCLEINDRVIKNNKTLLNLLEEKLFFYFVNTHTLGHLSAKKYSYAIVA